MEFEIGARVKFREDTPQYPANKDIVYVVQRNPSGLPSVYADGRRYCWLVVEADLDKPPSRRRKRSGWEDALIAVSADEPPAGP